MSDKYPKLIKVYYEALMIYLVFSFAQNLLSEMLGSFHVDNLLYVILWLTLFIQTTYAYVHIREIKPEKYSKGAFISDCIDVLAELYFCVAIMCIYRENIYDYRHLSIPFVVIELNQFVWFVIVREFNASAVFRICLLLLGMLGVTISESIYPNNEVNLYIIVGLMVLITILRAVNKVPACVNDVITRSWYRVKPHVNKN